MSTKPTPDAEQTQNLPLNGRWTWKADMSGLEYVSNVNNADKQDKKKGRGKGVMHFQDGAKRNERAVSSIAGRSLGKGRGQTVGGHHSPGARLTAKKSADHTHVTLEDVKSVAMGMLSEIEHVSDSFVSMLETEQFDEFLAYLLNYFNIFLVKRAQETKPNPMNIEPSLAEKKAYEDACAKLGIAQKQLGQAYCILVLGLGLEQQHHMACGQSRVSNTYRDRSMYETLYSFCTHLVWITYRRKEFDVVKKEIGRMLRSDTFNPAERVKNAPDQEVEEENREEEKKPEKKLTPAEYRRLHGKRPAIKQIINQRSPAVVAILPEPREEADWLFKRVRPLSPNSLSKMGRENKEEADSKKKAFKPIVIEDPRNYKVGIIGEPLSLFNSNLAPVGSENDEEEHEEGRTKMEKPPQPAAAAQPPAIAAAAQPQAVVRQTTNTTQAPTEVQAEGE